MTNQAWGQTHSGDMLEFLSQLLIEFLFNWILNLKALSILQISRQIFDLVEGEAITTTKTPLESIRPQWPDLLSAFSQE